MGLELAGLELALEHSFVCRELLVQALTHRSLSFEMGLETGGKVADSEAGAAGPVVAGRADNERLEFLGDAVLGLVVAEALFESHPERQEGELTRMRAQLVSRKHMAEAASAIGLGEYMRLGKGEERTGGRRKPAILANAMEAVIAAMYLDAAGDAAGETAGQVEGGLAPVRRFARRHILGSAADELAEGLRNGAALGDHKSALQEYLQASRAGVPVYVVGSESGPDHRKRFEVELRLKSAGGTLGEVVAGGSGSTKKKAEQEAARRALEVMAARAVRDAVVEERPGA